MALVNWVVVSVQHAEAPNSSMMSSGMLPAWQLTPSLRAHVKMFPQVYRGETWYVVFDQSADKYLRFDTRSYQIIGRINGHSSLEQIFEAVNSLNDYAQYSRQEFISFIAQLNSAEILEDGLPFDLDQRYQRHTEQKQQMRQKRIMNPLAIRLKLLNPQPIINRLNPIAQFMFSPLGLAFWLSVVMLAVILGIAYAPELVAQVSAMSLSTMQIVIIWLVYPVIKVLHELGHGLAVKKWGGAVREAGINLMVFLPVPYVDASSSWTFTNKWKRITVGAAGIMTELFIAAIAMFIWLLVEPGLVQEVMLNVMVIAIVSTLLFNGNPLLKFDGYFVLEDAIEIPNLATRSKQYYLYLVQRYLLNLKDKVSPVSAFGERRWFLIYGLLSPLYRLFIMFTIAIYLASFYLFIGVLLAVWVILIQLIVPVFKGFTYLLTHSDFALNRNKGYLSAIGVMLGIVVILLLPMPLVTSTEGVVTVEGNNKVVAQTEGFIESVFIESGEQVERGQVLFKLRNIELLKQKQILQQQLKQTTIRLNQIRFTDRVKANNLNADLAYIQGKITEVNRQLENTYVKSPTNGTFLSVQTGVSQLGQYYKQGSKVGMVFKPASMIIASYIPQDRIGLMQDYDYKVAIAMASNTKNYFTSEVIHETPKAQKKLAYQALLIEGGGELQTLSKEDELYLKTPVFIYDLKLPENSLQPILGERVYVRFDYGYAALGYQLWLSLQKLFLSYLGESL